MAPAPREHVPSQRGCLRRYLEMQQVLFILLIQIQESDTQRDALTGIPSHGSDEIYSLAVAVHIDPDPGSILPESWSVNTRKLSLQSVILCGILEVNGPML